MADVSLTKNQDGTWKVTVSKNVPQNEEHVFGNIDEAVNKIKEVESQEQPQG